MKGKALRVACFLPFMFFLSSFACAAETIQLRFANFFPPTHAHSVIFAEWTQRLNKDLAGKGEIAYHGGGTLLPGPKIAAGISAGIADIGIANVGYTRGRFPVMEIFGLPLGCPSPWIGMHVANDFYDKFQPKEWSDYQPLMFATSSATSLQTIKKEVRTLEDLKGLKISAAGRVAATVKALGATPVPVEMVDLYEALHRGVIDGHMGNMEQLKGGKTGGVIKHVTAAWKIGGCDTFYVVMNKKKWDGLPADVQKTVTAVTNEYKEKWAKIWNEIDIEGLDFFKKQGGQVIELSDAEVARWIKACDPVIAEFKKDLMGKGYKAAEIDNWLSFIKERSEYWKGREKAGKIATVYQY